MLDDDDHDHDDYMGGRMSTGDAARELGISEPYLQALIRRGKVAAPPKTRGKRKWSPTWIEKAKASLARYS